MRQSLNAKEEIAIGAAIYADVLVSGQPSVILRESDWQKSETPEIDINVEKLTKSELQHFRQVEKEQRERDEAILMHAQLMNDAQTVCYDLLNERKFASVVADWPTHATLVQSQLDQAQKNATIEALQEVYQAVSAQQLELKNRIKYIEIAKERIQKDRLEPSLALGRRVQ